MNEYNNIVKGQAGDRITIKAKVKGGISITSHYANIEEFEESMKRQGREVIEYKII